MTGGMGLANLVSAVTPAVGNQLRLLEEVVRMEVRQSARLATAASTRVPRYTSISPAGTCGSSTAARTVISGLV